MANSSIIGSPWCPKLSLRWCLNCGCFAGVCILLTFFGLNYIGVALPSLRCSANGELDEPELSHAYQGDTVTVPWLLGVVLIMPLGQILLTEYAYGRRHRFFPLYWDYFVGLIFTVLVIDIAKSTLNAPRPHFLDTCKPIYDKQSCTNGWISTYSCSNPAASRWRMVDAHKSFPSGHAAIGAYAATWFIFYHSRALSAQIIGLVPILVLNTVWIGWGVLCGLSRIRDRRHHLLDVVVGAIIGVIGACGIVFLSRKVEAESKSASASSAHPHGSVNGAPSSHQFSLRRLLSSKSTVSEVEPV